MIDKLNTHYSMTNPASVYDEESLTALELAGRTTAKVNEVVDSQNQLVTDTEKHLAEQDSTIDERLSEQDSNIENIRTVTVPADVTKEVQRQIDVGTFNEQIDISLNNLNERVDNLLGEVVEGSTTLDAEIIDARVDVNGDTHTNLGASIREMTKSISKPINNTPYLITPATVASFTTISVDDGVYSCNYTYDASVLYSGIGVPVGKTQAQLQNKSIYVIFHRLDNPVKKLRLMKLNQSWNSSTMSFTQFSDNMWKLDVDNSVDLGTNNLYFSCELYVDKTNTMEFSLYVLPTNINNQNVCGYSMFALNSTPPKEVKLSQNAGWSTKNFEMFTKDVKNNSGNMTFDGENKFTLTVKNFSYNTSTPVFTAGSIDITEHGQLKGIYIDFEGDITNIVLTQSINNWSQPITNLSKGYNDLSYINFSDYERVYVTLGIYAHSEGDKEGCVRIWCVGNNEVIATRYIGDEKTYENEIVCWGDSLTAGGGWTTTLAELSGVRVLNAGTGGENTHTICARQGADCMIINNVTIPADTTAVTLATYSEGFTTELGNKATPLLQGGTHVNPVTIAGVEGTLKWTGSSYNDTSGVWTFTRSTAGDKVVIDRPTAIITAYDRLHNNPFLMVLYMGTNGSFDSIDDLINQHKQMIDHSNAKHVVVLGMTHFARISDVSEYETKMRQAFGRYFVSLRDYLSKYGLSDAGLTPTTEDTNAMSTGAVPPQLLSDGVHYTNACKTVIGNMLYKKCKELNIF